LGLDKSRNLDDEKLFDDDGRVTFWDFLFAE
jgi:hypothetical protein